MGPRTIPAARADGGPGITSKTRLYRAAYAVVGPLFPLWRTLLPRHVTTTQGVGRAMIEVARHGAPQRLLENREIAELGRRSGGAVTPGTSAES